jgi:glycosyltransferase involved in cell wall biosynthesis
LSQTYTNIEYIIVDGASSDNTKQIVNRYQDERIKYIYVEKYGRTLQTKIGFENSTGKYITFLDDDDEYLLTKIEKQVKLFETLSVKYGFVYCWMSYFDNKTNKFLYDHKAELRGNVADMVVEKPIISGSPTLLFRSEVFKELGGSWKENIGLHGSDWELAARACQKYLVDYVPESLVKVYINHGLNRASDKGYFPDLLERKVKYHLYFLSEYKYIFEKYPQKKNWHLFEISRSYFMLNEWKNGWPYYKSLLVNYPTIKVLLLPAYCIIKRKR